MKNDVVFIGGATISLYAEIPFIEVRPTNDIDILVELYTRTEYVRLEEKLRQKGFANDTSSKFLGRYIVKGIVVDVMPTDEAILGFSNQWYTEGYAHAVDHKIDEQHEVKIFPAPYFIASKLEAFKERGKNSEGELDGRTSHDFEDLIFVLEHRTIVWDEMNESEETLRIYLKKEFSKLFSLPYFENGLRQVSIQMDQHPSPLILQLD